MMPELDPFFKVRRALCPKGKHVHERTTEETSKHHRIRHRSTNAEEAGFDRPRNQSGITGQSAEPTKGSFDRSGS